MDIDNRVKKMADLILNKKSTVREVAKIIGLSKSTVHKDLTERLPKIDYDKYLEVKKLLEYNKTIKHIRGGISTKIKYNLIKYPNPNIHQYFEL